MDLVGGPRISHSPTTEPLSPCSCRRTPGGPFALIHSQTPHRNREHTAYTSAGRKIEPFGENLWKTSPKFNQKSQNYTPQAKISTVKPAPNVPAGDFSRNFHQFSGAQRKNVLLTTSTKNRKAEFCAISHMREGFSRRAAAAPWRWVNP